MSLSSALWDMGSHEWLSLIVGGNRRNDSDKAYSGNHIGIFPKATELGTVIRALFNSAGNQGADCIH